MACHMYDNKYCKVLTMDCYDMQSEDGATHTLSSENLSVDMACNGVPSVNFKDSMADTTQAN